MPSNHLFLCHPLLRLPSIFPNIKVFSNELALCIRWPKYRSFSIIPSNEHSGLISFRMDWLDLLAVQGTLKSLLHTAVQKHQFFGGECMSVQLSWFSHPLLSLLCPQDHPRRLHLYSCSAKRLTGTIFLHSINTHIYICINIQYFFFSFWLTLCDRFDKEESNKNGKLCRAINTSNQILGCTVSEV